MTSFQRTRILLSLVLGLFVLTASATAEVTYDSEAGTFTGDGTYSEAVDATVNLTATPTTGQTITFTNTSFQQAILLNPGRSLFSIQEQSIPSIRLISTTVPAATMKK
ncbi:MAG: hypothetical protein IJQ39_00540 [Thermoguttaceae bacterium]|nr:hypothetical protein [Thermoguttaceae bacterium]